MGSLGFAAVTSRGAQSVECAHLELTADRSCPLKCPRVIRCPGYLANKPRFLATWSARMTHTWEFGAQNLSGPYVSLAHQPSWTLPVLKWLISLFWEKLAMQLDQWHQISIHQSPHHILLGKLQSNPGFTHTLSAPQSNSGVTEGASHWPPLAFLGDLSS